MLWCVKVRGSISIASFGCFLAPQTVDLSYGRALHLLYHTFFIGRGARPAWTFQLSKCRVENQTGPLFDYQMALLSFDKNNGMSR
jgi:hypothetical protein